MQQYLPVTPAQMTLNFLQINLKNKKTATDLFSQTCREQEIDVAIVSEPNRGRIPDGAQGWVLGVNNRAAIYLGAVRTRERARLVGSWFVAVDLGTVTVFACYMSPNVDFETFEAGLEELSRSIRGRRNMIIGGDFNAKAWAWRSPVQDRRGEALVEWAASVDLTILNRGDKPTYEGAAGRSYIDVTFCTAGLVNKVQDWHVDDQENLSDHNNIRFVVLREPRLVSTNETRTSWIYKEECKESVLLRLTFETANLPGITTVEDLMGALTEACRAALRQRGRGGRKKGVYWWNEEIAALRRNCLRKKRTTTRLNGRQGASERERIVAREEYRWARKQLNNAILTAKKRAWVKVCEEVNQDTTYGTVGVISVS